jgi:1-acyl-sn-glycerol-3-phosphate acyltransferase
MLTELRIPALWGGTPEGAWRIARNPVIVLMRALAPTGGYGVDRMPAAGGAVLAMNHFSALDPTLVGIYSMRSIYYMAKIELLDVPVAGEMLRWTGSFAVRRGEGDRDSIRVARWLVANGHLVGMYAEGTRQRFGYPGSVNPGAVMIALQERVPVVPCGLDSFGWSLSNRRPCAVVFGDPISLDGLAANGRGYKEGAVVVEKAIHRLWRQAAQAAVDGLPEALEDGTRRSDPIWTRHAHPPADGPGWPHDEWAAGPLGPVYAGRT